MKKLLLGLILVANSALAVVHQDIVFKSRFDMGTSQSFIQQLRVFLGNNNFGDPYQRTFTGPIDVDLKKAINEVPADTQKWIREVQELLKISVFDSDYKLSIKNLSYSISEFNSLFRPGENTDGRVEYVTINYIHGLNLKADSVVFEVALSRTQTGNPIKFQVQLHGVDFLVGKDLLTELEMGWATEVLRDNILITLDKIDISKVMQKVFERPEEVILKIKDISIPKVSIKIGNKEVKFSEEKIKRFFRENQHSVKKGLIDIVRSKMSHSFTNVIGDASQKLYIPRTYGFASDINGVLDVQKMDVNNSGIVQIDVDAHFCDDPGSIRTDYCINGKVSAKKRRKISDDQYNRSLREINRSLIEKRTNLSLSVSEDYLNQLIEATIRAGLWEKVIGGKDFKLGPEKSFVLADERGSLFSLYLDIIYPIRGSQRLIIGKSELRFPIKFMIDLNIKEVNGVPRLLISVQKIATDDKLLLEGLKEFGLESNVKTVKRFRQKVLRTIHEELSAFMGDVLVDISMNELKGTYLEELEFFSDGLGRATATMGFRNMGTKQ